MTAPDASAPLPDGQALHAWASSRLPGSRPLTATRPAAGHRNLTFMLSAPTPRPSGKPAGLLEASCHRRPAAMSDDPFFARLESGVPEPFARARERCGA